MDWLIVILIASALFVAGLPGCLSCVGFGRAAIVSAIVATVAFSVSAACLQTLPLLDEIPFSTFEKYSQASDRFDRFLFIAEIGLYVGKLSATVFCLSGALRVWRRRSTLVTRYNTSLAQSVGPTVNPNNERSGFKRRCVGNAAFGTGLGICGFLFCQILYDFVVTDRGLQFYRDNPLVLLYLIIAAAIGSNVLVLFSRYARRGVQSVPDPCGGHTSENQTTPVE